jgi:hypothetical protein
MLPSQQLHLAPSISPEHSSGQSQEQAREQAAHQACQQRLPRIQYGRHLSVQAIADEDNGIDPIAPDVVPGKHSRVRGPELNSISCDQASRPLYACRLGKDGAHASPGEADLVGLNLAHCTLSGLDD